MHASLSDRILHHHHPIAPATSSAEHQGSSPVQLDPCVVGLGWVERKRSKKEQEPRGSKGGKIFRVRTRGSKSLLALKLSRGLLPLHLFGSERPSSRPSVVQTELDSLPPQHRSKARPLPSSPPSTSPRARPLPVKKSDRQQRKAHFRTGVTTRPSGAVFTPTEDEKRWVAPLIPSPGHRQELTSWLAAAAAQEWSTSSSTSPSRSPTTPSRTNAAALLSNSPASSSETPEPANDTRRPTRPPGQTTGGQQRSRSQMPFARNPIRRLGARCSVRCLGGA